MKLADSAFSARPKPWDAPTPRSASQAREVLQALVACMDAGHRRPLPLLPELIEAWARAVDDDEGLDAARQGWFADAQAGGQPPRHDHACRRIWPEPSDPFADHATAAACRAAMALLRAVAAPPAAAQGAGT